MNSFTHHFKGDLSCTITAADSATEGSGEAILSFCWSRVPTPDEAHTIFEDYRDWIKESCKSISRSWGHGLVYCLATNKGTIEVWSFTGNSEKLIATKLLHRGVKPSLN